MTEAEYLLLCNLLYLNEFSVKKYEDKTIEYIIDHGVDTTLSDSYTTSQEYQDLLNLVSQSDEIGNLRIVSTYRDNDGGKAACFVTPDGQPIVVFRGTGEDEWPDNMQGANATDTKAQKAALKWMQTLQREMGYDDFIVTGHSKGGNKAMYLAVVSGMVSQCYSFDGQGFSPEFLAKYAPEIAAMQRNIFSISHSRDFVNILMFSITNNQKYLENYAHVNGFAEYHTPNALFKYEWVYDAAAGEWVMKPTLELATESEQSTLMKVLNGFGCDLLESSSPWHEQEIVDILSILTGNIFGKGEDQDLPEISSVVQGIYVLEKLNEYLQKLKTTDPLLYSEMMKELYDVLVDTMGLTRANFIMRHFGDGALNAADILPILTDKSLIGISLVRDFTAEAKQVLLDTVKEVETEEWFNITRWDCWYGVQQLLGGLNIEDYAGEISTYHRKLIDLNNSTADDIEKLFSDVYEIDREYAGKIKAHTATLEEELGKLKTAVDRLVPA